MIFIDYCGHNYFIHALIFFIHVLVIHDPKVEAIVLGLLRLLFNMYTFDELCF